MIRLQQVRLSPFSFPLDGFKKIFAIMEEKFHRFTALGKPPVTLEFSPSQLLKNYRLSNELRTAADRQDANFNLQQVFQKLLDHSPPDSDQLIEEGSGAARVQVFVQQTEAEFLCRVKSPGDKVSLKGLGPNILRVASDFYWGHFVCSFLNSGDVLTSAKELELNESLDQILLKGKVIIPDAIILSLFRFMRYCLIGSFHLNHLAAGILSPLDDLNVDDQEKRKRHLIIERMAQGFSPRKKRKFSKSKLSECLRNMEPVELTNQLRVLESHVVIEKPSYRSFQLVREFSSNAKTYLAGHCLYQVEDVVRLEEKIAELRD